MARHHAVRPLPIAAKAVIVGLVLTFVLSTVSRLMLGAKQPPAGTGFPLTGWHVFGGGVTLPGKPGDQSGFDGGVHACLGTAIARLSTKIAFEEFHKWCPHTGDCGISCRGSPHRISAARSGWT